MPDPFARRKRTPGEEEPTTSTDPFARTGKSARAARKKLAEYEALAQQHGVEIKNPETNPIMDALRRPEYAMAAGYEAAGEHGMSPQVPIAMGKEFLSGLPGIHGDKQTMGELALQKGVPEFGHLSDVPFVGLLYNKTGEGWQMLQGGHADPTFRDMAMGAAVQAADPVTYTGFGAEGPKLAQKGMTEVFRLSEKGLAARGKLVLEELPKARQLAVRFMRRVKLSPDQAATRAAQSDKLALDVAFRQANKRLYDTLAKGEMQEALDLGGVKFAGRTVIPGKTFKPFGKFVGKSAATVMARMDENPIGSQILNMGRNVATQLDKTFNSTLAGARRYPEYTKLVDEWRTGKRASRGLLQEWLNELFHGAEDKAVEHQGKSIPLLYYIRRSAENPEAYPVDKIPAEYMDEMGAMREAYDTWFTNEVRAKIMDPGQHRQNYIPLMTRNSRKQMDQLKQEYYRQYPATSADLASIGPFGEPRYFKNLDEMEAFHKQLYDSGVINWKLRPVEDPTELLWKRGVAHYSAIHGQRFYHGVKKLIGISNKEVQLQTFRRALPGVTEALVAGDKSLLSKVSMADIDQAAGTIAGVRPEKLGDYPFTAKTPIRKPKFPKKTVRYPVTERVTEMVEHTPEPRPTASKRLGGGLDAGVERAGDDYSNPALSRRRMQALVSEPEIIEPEPKTWQPPSFRTPKTSDVKKIVTRTDPARAGRELSPAAKALVLAARLRDSESPEAFFKNLTRLKKPLEEADPELLHTIDGIVGGERQKAFVGAFNEPIEEVKDRGPLTGYWLPRSITDDFEHKEDLIPEIALRELQPLVAAYDRVIAYNKGMLTVLHPAFHVRNKTSNVSQGFVDIGFQRFNPRRSLQVKAISAGMDGTVKTPYGNFTHDQFRHLAREMGITGHGVWQANDILRPDLAHTQRTIGSKPLRIAREIAEAPGHLGRYVGTKIEEGDKLSLFLAHMERGLSPTEAAMRVHKFLFDYEDISPREKAVLRRAIPFYTWPKKNIELTTKELLHRPGRYAAMVKAFPADRGPDEASLPDYQSGDMKIKIKKNGKAIYVTGLDLPLNGYTDYITPESLGEGARKFWGQLSPAIKLIPEIAAQENIAFGRDFSGRQKIAAQVQPTLEQIPKPLLDYFGYNPETGDMNYGKYYLYFKFYAISRAMSYLEKLPAKPDEEDAFVVNALSGIKWSEVELPGGQAQEKAMRARLAIVSRRLVELGLLDQTTITYEPKSK